MQSVSDDTLFEGKLYCRQHRDGYRFSIDSVLLAHFCMSWKDAEILDLGCGCGVLGLILFLKNRKKIRQITCFDYQNQLIELTRNNISENGFSAYFTTLEGDYTEIENHFPAEIFSHVICNPPFFRTGSGRTSTNREAYLARHQGRGGINAVTKAISYVLANKGVASLIYPAERLSELMESLINCKLRPKVIRFIYSYPEAEEARLVMIESRKNGGEGLKVLPPLFIYSCKNGNYSPEVENMYQP